MFVVREVRDDSNPLSQRSCQPKSWEIGYTLRKGRKRLIMRKLFANHMHLAASSAIPFGTFKSAGLTILSVAGPLFFMGMQISSLKTAVTISYDKSVGSLSPIPFLSLFTNGCVWFIYGCVQNDWTVLIPNFSAILVGVICVIIFHKNSEKGISYFLYSIAFMVVVPSILFGIAGDIVTLGLVGVFVSILLMGSPLSTVSIVLKERRTDSMPFATSLMAFLNSLSWSLYGYMVVDDPILWLPSAIGFILSSFQLMLFGVYGFPQAAEASQRIVVISIPVMIFFDHNLPKKIMMLTL